MSIITVANLLPVVGLVGLGWGVTELLVVYWIEAVIATLVGMVKTVPAKLVGVPMSDPRSTPSIRARHGTVSIRNGRFFGYVRNVPIVGAQSMFLPFLTISVAAFLVPASPVYYSPRGTAESVAVVAGVLAGTHLLTAHAYFAEKRYDQTVAEGIARSWFVTGAGVFGLVVVLWSADASTSGPVLAAWPPVLSYVLVGGKLGTEILLRCRDRDFVEDLEDDVDPFEFQTDAVDVLLLRTPGMKAAELPRVDRPTTRPQATVRPSRWRLLRASPVLGFLTSRSGAPILFTGMAIFLVVADLPLVFPLAAFGIGTVFAVVPVVVSVLPRHATLAYEFYDDRLVCHDRWLDEPVWSLPYEDVTAVSVERGLDARVGGYGTVVVETTDDRPARLSYLRDYRAVADRLEGHIDDGR